MNKKQETLEALDPAVNEEKIYVSQRAEEVLAFANESDQAAKAAHRERLIVATSTIAGLLVVWQLAAQFVIADNSLLPGPVSVIRTFIYYLSHPYPSRSGTLEFQLVYSILRILTGFVAGVVVGVGIGSLMSVSRYIRYAIDPLVEFMRPLPPLAFIPLLVVWFGIGELPKVVLIFIGVVPIMVISTLAGLDAVAKELMDAAMTLGATKSYALWHVKVRAALVQIVTGMRLAIGVSWTSIVAAEMIAARHGIGFVILEAGNYLDTALVFAAIITIGVVGLTMDWGLRRLLRILKPF